MHKNFLVLDDSVIYPTITEQDFGGLIQHPGALPFLVVFTAEWLGEGTIMDAIVETMADDFKGVINFYRIDVEASKNISNQLGIRQLPAMYFFKDGELAGHFSGMMPKKALTEKLQNLL